MSADFIKKMSLDPYRASGQKISMISYLLEENQGMRLLISRIDRVRHPWSDLLRKWIGSIAPV
jgi:hypothetical protein